MIAIVQLLVFCSILLILDDELNITSRTVLVVVALLTPSILISFNRLNAPERDILFFLACLVLSVERFERTHSAAWAIAAVVSAQIMMYCKETVFLMVFGFAVSRLILRYRNERLAGRGYRLWARESRLDMCLASLAVVFLILYVGFVGNANMKVCWLISSATSGRRARLYKGGFFALATCSGLAGQDLYDSATPGGTLAIVGCTGGRRRGLLSRLYLSRYVQSLLHGTGGSHRGAICWSVCGAFMEKDAFMGQNSSNTAGIDDQFSRRLGFNFCYIRKKERYPRKGGNIVSSRDTIQTQLQENNLGSFFRLQAVT